jgi:molybdopterin synthase catalytic subunit
MARVRVQREDFDPGAEAEALARGRIDVGAMVSFIGYCRDEGGSLAALELEHYPGMVEEEVARATSEAEARWPLLGATVIHRYGGIAPGERIVFVAVDTSVSAQSCGGTAVMNCTLMTGAPSGASESSPKTMRAARTSWGALASSRANRTLIVVVILT